MLAYDAQSQRFEKRSQFTRYPHSKREAQSLMRLLSRIDVENPW
jgi:hypothetical protein